MSIPTVEVLAGPVTDTVMGYIFALNRIMLIVATMALALIIHRLLSQGPCRGITAFFLANLNPKLKSGPTDEVKKSRKALRKLKRSGSEMLSRGDMLRSVAGLRRFSQEVGFTPLGGHFPERAMITACVMCLFTEQQCEKAVLPPDATDTTMAMLCAPAKKATRVMWLRYKRVNINEDHIEKHRLVEVDHPMVQFCLKHGIHRFTRGRDIEVESEPRELCARMCVALESLMEFYRGGMPKYHGATHDDCVIEVSDGGGGPSQLVFFSFRIHRPHECGPLPRWPSRWAGTEHVIEKKTDDELRLMLEEFEAAKQAGTRYEKNREITFAVEVGRYRSLYRLETSDDETASSDDDTAARSDDSSDDDEASDGTNSNGAPLYAALTVWEDGDFDCHSPAEIGENNAYFVPEWDRRFQFLRRLLPPWYGTNTYEVHVAQEDTRTLDSFSCDLQRTLYRKLKSMLLGLVEQCRGRRNPVGPFRLGVDLFEIRIWPSDAYDGELYRLLAFIRTHDEAQLRKVIAEIDEIETSEEKMIGLKKEVK